MLKDQSYFHTRSGNILNEFDKRDRQFIKVSGLNQAMQLRDILLTGLETPSLNLLNV